MNSDTEFARGETTEHYTVVAAFADRATAKAAASALHAEGFHHTWIGVTRAEIEIDEADDSGSITTTIDDGSLRSKIGRFFSGGTGTSLYEALQHHGVSDIEALRIDSALEPNDVVLTVDGANHPELAASIIEDLNGDVMTGGYEDANLYARDERIDAAGRSRLRDARMRAATVPVLHEEFFVIESLFGDSAAVDGAYEEYDSGRAAGVVLAGRPRMQ